MTLIDNVELWRMMHNDAFYFESMQIDERLDKHYVYDIIMTQYMNMTTLYSDTELYHKAIELFWVKNKDRISKLLDTLEIEYNPIENYSTIETGTAERKGSKDLSKNGETNSTINKTVDASVNKSTNTETEDKHFVSPYNNVNGNDVGASRDTGTASEHSTEDSTETTTQTGKETSEATEKTSTGENETTLGTKKGITNLSYQELIEKQRRTVMFDIDDFILKEFAKELLISIW